MTRRTSAAIVLLAGLSSGATAQTSLQAVYDSAYYAWDAGRYPDALATFDRLLRMPGGEAYLGDVAVLTGTEMQIDSVPHQDLRQGFGEFGFLMGHDAQAAAEKTDSCAVAGVHLRELDADVAGADDRHGAR